MFRMYKYRWGKYGAFHHYCFFKDVFDLFLGQKPGRGGAQILFFVRLNSTSNPAWLVTKIAWEKRIALAKGNVLASKTIIFKVCYRWFGQIVPHSV